ncbi:ras-specific guanine nucleotide-releasing factor 2-like [Belonocnema kinseyi]|uniref:ras-specific guanine nucleotide-releasing factor 2-like n=1 Tax=Belonocnema kinseyi TaxID=2817044 RepID=UPI00143CF7B5|nr:ras-specific guanine nucleotide-releasing factor 2-like [Belonocnema kinseyi]
MLSPKMQRTVRVNDSQLVMLSERAHYDHSLSGYLHKRTADSAKWQLRWFVLYQNLLFYYENETSSRPSGIIFLEGCYCDRFITAKSKEPDKQHCFAVSYRRENQRQYELKAATEADCKMWIDAIREASFNKLLLQKEELEQKHLHLLQIVESEKTAKWQYTRQCEELTSEIKKLRAELCTLKKELRPNNVVPTTTYGMGRNPLQRTLSQCSGSDNIGDSSNTSTSGNGPSAGFKEIAEGSSEMQKIKKVQSFFRGWLCRRRWKQIVEQYIKSPHAESMRKRNSLVFQMVEAEEEYTDQMETLVSCFSRPFKMAASSKKPPCSHEDVNSIFLNSETVLFLHQIFLKGLTSRMESWPTLVLGDLFDMLLPMLSIYQEYVRNHHYSLQVLTECKQSSPAFAALLSRLENKTACQGRSLETFLTYPMHQVPRYIITLHELLAHTPHDHVERKSLQNARQQLEHLSRQMHDEVSETENLRKNLAVERMIAEGCDILLDVNQVFVRQGALIQITEKSRGARSRLSATFGGKGGNSDKETSRQCFLFSNHLILATRQSDDDGRLNLVPQIGKIPLCDAILIEDPSDQNATDDDALSVCSMSSGISESSGSGSGSGGTHTQNRDFKIVLDLKAGGGQMIVHLIAPTMQEKAAWISDISQCMDNVRFNDFLHSSLSETSSVTMPQSIRNDPKLFKDDVDIRFSRTLNSCKVPQIRYATPERLLQRLTDLRFLSIDFLNTFLLTYRVFTDGVTVLEALKKVFYDTEPPDSQISYGGILSLDVLDSASAVQSQHFEERPRRSLSPRRTSGASSVSGYGSEVSDSRETSRNHSHCENTAVTTSAQNQNNVKSSHWRSGFRKMDEEHSHHHHHHHLHQLGQIAESTPTIAIKPSPQSQNTTSSEKLESPTDLTQRKISIRIQKDSEESDSGSIHLKIPSVITVSSSAETLTDVTIISAPSSPSNLSSVTLVGSTGSGSGSDPSPHGEATGRTYSGDISEDTDTSLGMEMQSNQENRFTYDDSSSPSSPPQSSTSMQFDDRPSTTSSNLAYGDDRQSSAHSECGKNDQDSSEDEYASSSAAAVTENSQHHQHNRSIRAFHRASVVSAPPSMARSGSFSIAGNYWAGRRSIQEGEMNSCSQQSSFQHDVQQSSSKAGVVITSFRLSRRRNSNSTAATAFAIATSASSNPPDKVHDRHGMDNDCGGGYRSGSCRFKNRRKESVMSTAATMRVLNVLRHWVSKHAQDFELDQRLKDLTIEFLDDIVYSPNLLPAEHKAASQLLRLITKEEPESSKVDLNQLLIPPLTQTKENIETLSALEIAEQMTYLDHRIFISIASEEFLGQAWMKTDKATRAPHIILMTRRFNQVSQLVVSEIVRRTNMSARVAAIEKWAAVADISRVLHNYNGVLQICAAFTNTSVYRLKKTWEKVSKTTKQTIERLQNIVSSDGRFRNLRDALHRCDPPCIPYLGLYLTDLSFIEEGTPNFTEDGLLNFSKMRMIAHVIREIRHFQQTPYKIELISKVTNYLLDPSLLLDDDEMYRISLEIEPRTSRLSNAGSIGIPLSHFDMQLANGSFDNSIDDETEMHLEENIYIAKAIDNDRIGKTCEAEKTCLTMDSPYERGISRNLKPHTCAVPELSDISGHHRRKVKTLGS